MTDDVRFMRLALEQANAGDRKKGAGEVGCVIVRDGEVLASGYNEAEMRHDPTAHAEIVTLRKLGQQLEAVEFPGSTLYCTLQPCGMCTMACVWAKVSRIVYGATRADVHSMYFEQRHLNTSDFIRDAFRNDIEVTPGVLASECSALYFSPGSESGASPVVTPLSVIGVAETALYVSDLARSEHFYRRLFGFETIFTEGDRMRALAVPNQQVLLLFRCGASTGGIQSSGGRIPGHDGGGNLHMAFSIPREQAGAWAARLAEFGAHLESRVQCPAGGVSLYFRDPDDHLIELITPGCWTWPGDRTDAARLP